VPFTMDYTFAAGTMFWARMSLFEPLIEAVRADRFMFEDEAGQSDHTMAHAMERFFGLLCHVQHLRIEESPSDYRLLDRETLEDLAVLAFTQRFDYDLVVHQKNLIIHERDRQIQERDEELYALLTSKSYRYTKPFRHLEFLVKTIWRFDPKKLRSPGTDEHRLALAVKRRIPQKLFYLIKSVLQRKLHRKRQDVFWNEPLGDTAVCKSRHIVIVAELSIPQCKKYRVDQKAEMLEMVGYTSTVVSWTEYETARNALQHASLAFFYRVPAQPTVLQLMEECERLGIPSVFDLDDLIFDKELLQQNRNVQSLPSNVQKEVFAGAETYAKALSSAQYASASTPVLAEHMERVGGNRCFVIPNALDREILSIADATPPRQKTDDTVTIVYGSGTSTHDFDFLECAPALLSILKRYPHVRFVIHGTLNLPESFNDVRDKITTVPFMPADAYYQALSHYDINISPLEPTVFNDAKSNIKFIEASMFKLPTIASQAASFQEVIRHKENGLLAGDEQAWYDAFAYLIEHPHERRRIGEEAYKTTLERYAPETVAQEYLRPLLEQLAPKPEAETKQVMTVNILYKPISYGGATIVVEELTRRLHATKEFDVTVVTAFFDSDRHLSSEYDIVRYESHGVPVILIRLPEPMLPVMEYRNERMGELFDRLISALQPDLVHFHSIQQLSASIIEPCIQRAIPYLITLHDMWWVCARQFMIMPNGTFCGQTRIDTSYCQTHCAQDKGEDISSRTRYLSRFLNRADMLLAPSRYQKEMYAQNIDTPERLHVNKNGILLPAKDFAKQRNARIRFAYVGGNAVHKGYHFLKEIFTELDEEDYTLVVVDLGQKLGYPTIFASDWNIRGELVISEGYDNSVEGLDNFYKDIDVLLFPSQCKESFGLTVREAMARDVWVISTDAGGVVEDIDDGVNGDIVAMHDKQGFKEKIRERIRRFSPDTPYTNPHKEKIRDFDEQARELEAYYRRILQQRERP